MEDDAMEIDETISSAQIIVREETGIKLIGGSATAVSPPEDVVVLLEDDDDNVEIIDLVEKSANSQCINYACKSGKDLLLAPHVCLSYYRVKKTGKGKKEVCTECFDLAFQHYQQLVDELKSGSVLCGIDIPLRNDTLEIDDSSDEELSDNCEISIDSDNCEFITDNFDAILNQTLQRMNFSDQYEKEVDFVKKKAESVSDSLEQLNNTLKNTRNNLDALQIGLYSEFRAESFECSVISIIDDTNLKSTPIVVTESVKTYQQRKSQRISNKPAQPTPPPPSMPVLPTTTDFIDLPPDVPQIGELVIPPLIPEEVYYVSREYKSGNWIKARLRTIYPPGTPHNESHTPSNLYLVRELKQAKERVVDGKNIALMQPSRTRLEIGQRVIAAFKEAPNSAQNSSVKKPRTDPLYPGMVAEPPVAKNRFRYLIFFDIGYSQYVHCALVHVVLECSKNVWEDMAVSCRPFIQKYLQTVDDRPMVRLMKGQTIRTEYNGKWVLCTVLDVDCSLVLVDFMALNRTEWIYRGSRRLSAMFKEEQNANKRHTGGRTSTRKIGSDESVTIVQYTKNSEFSSTAPAVAAASPPKVQNRAVARKSTATKQEPVSASSTIPFLPSASTIANEPTSKIMYFTPRDQVITQRMYRSHSCSPICKDFVRYGLNKLRGHNPLAKPLLSGWARVTLKVKARKEIIYKAPCGRMLRSMGEVHKYLKLTKSEMTVDLFDFNHNVRCLAEFNVDCPAEPKDLSGGLEQVAIPVINGLNKEVLEFCNYETRRVPMEGVPLNTDAEFLCGCDCEDGCANKLKCACWKLTLEGAKYMGKNVDPRSIGYTYRRLHEQVLTGIYECNARCKCNATCLNRVVQNPMSVKLQVFRTHNRGWGIRCVNDIPQGTFICIYAGTIHTEQMANVDGVTYGDEYFAELDYIENCEKHKEDYESDAVEPGDSPRSASPEDEDEDDDEEELEVVRSGRRKRYKAHDDNDFCPSWFVNVKDKEREISMKLRKRTVNEEVKPKKEEAVKVMDALVGDIETVTISDDEDDLKEVLSFNPKSGSELDDSKTPKYASVRSFFGEDEPYIMDTKNAGNIGRFLNHSCSPNVFVQNVFVDTHDLRFPWVAFFSSQFIRAGTELTWNYNYDIGSVPGRVLYCHCGSLECKGRLL